MLFLVVLLLSVVLIGCGSSKENVVDKNINDEESTTNSKAEQNEEVKVVGDEGEKDSDEALKKEKNGKEKKNNKDKDKKKEEDKSKKSSSEKPKQNDVKKNTKDNKVVQQGNKSNPSKTVDNSGKKEQTKQTKSKPKKPNVQKVSGTYYVTSSGLNVRSGDGTNYGIIGSLNLNKKVDVTGKTANGWYEFDYNGKKSFVSGNYLTTQKPKKSNANKTSTSNNSTNKGNKTNKNKGTSNSNNNKTNQNVVDKMTTLGNNRQVILVTTNSYGTYTGQVRTFDKDSNGKWHQKLSSTAYIGKNGFADNKREGDLKSPTGKYSIGHAFGYAGNPGTKLSFKSSTSNDVWVDDSNSKYYNTWQSKNKSDKDWKSAESMTHELYRYGFVINYNTSQTPNKGSAIFMHVARPGTGYTTGCTAVNQGDLLKIMKWVDPSKNPVIIQTPESGLSNY